MDSLDFSMGRVFVQRDKPGNTKLLIQLSTYESLLSPAVRPGKYDCRYNGTCVNRSNLPTKDKETIIFERNFMIDFFRTRLLKQ